MFYSSLSELAKGNVRKTNGMKVRENQNLGGEHPSLCTCCVNYEVFFLSNILEYAIYMKE